MTKQQALKILVHTWVDGHSIEPNSLASIRAASQYGESYLETLLRVIDIPTWTPNLFRMPRWSDNKDPLSFSERRIFYGAVRLAAEAAELDQQPVGS